MNSILQDLASGAKYHRKSTTKESSLRVTVPLTPAPTALVQLFSNATGYPTIQPTSIVSYSHARFANLKTQRTKFLAELPVTWCTKRTHSIVSKRIWSRSPKLWRRMVPFISTFLQLSTITARKPGQKFWRTSVQIQWARSLENFSTRFLQQEVNTPEYFIQTMVVSSETIFLRQFASKRGSNRSPVPLITPRVKVWLRDSIVPFKSRWLITDNSWQAKRWLVQKMQKVQNMNWKSVAELFLKSITLKSTAQSTWRRMRLTFNNTSKLGRLRCSLLRK